MPEQDIPHESPLDMISGRYASLNEALLNDTQTKIGSLFGDIPTPKLSPLLSNAEVGYNPIEHVARNTKFINDPNQRSSLDDDPFWQNYEDFVQSEKAVAKVTPAMRSADLQTARIDAGIMGRFVNEKYGYLPGTDNEDYYAQGLDKGLFSTGKDFFGRLIPDILLKTGDMLASGVSTIVKSPYVGVMSILEPDTNINVGDNALSTFFQGLEEDLKNDWLPTYQAATNRDKGFWYRMFHDGTFWTSDLEDGVAFLGGAFVTALLTEGVGLTGETGMVARATTRLMDAAEGAVNVNRAAKGLSAGMDVLAQQQVRAMAKDYVIKAAKWAKTADNIAVTSLNTLGEASMEARDTYKKVYEQMIADGMSDQDARNIASDAYKGTFGMNMVILGISNGLFETGLLQKGAGKLLGKTAAREEGTVAKTVFNEATGRAVEKKIGSKWLGIEPKSRAGRFVSRALNNRYTHMGYQTAKGTFFEGLWEENMQLATQRFYEDKRNLHNQNIGYFNSALNFFGVAKQAVEQVRGAWTGADPEAGVSIGLGGLIGVVGGGFSHLVSGGAGGFTDRRDKSIAAAERINQAIDNTFGDFYKRDEETGKYELGKDGKPVVDEEKMAAFMTKYQDQVAQIEGLKGIKDPTIRNFKLKDFYAGFIHSMIGTDLDPVAIMNFKFGQYTKGGEETIKAMGFKDTAEFEAFKKDIIEIADNAQTLNQSINDDVIFDTGKKAQARESARRAELLSIGTRQTIFSQYQRDLQKQISEVDDQIIRAGIGAGKDTLNYATIEELNQQKSRIKSNQEYINSLIAKTEQFGFAAEEIATAATGVEQEVAPGTEPTTTLPNKTSLESAQELQKELEEAHKELLEQEEELIKKLQINPETGEYYDPKAKKHILEEKKRQLKKTEGQNRNILEIGAKNFYKYANAKDGRQVWQEEYDEEQRKAAEAAIAAENKDEDETDENGNPKPKPKPKSKTGLEEEWDDLYEDIEEAEEGDFVKVTNAALNTVFGLPVAPEDSAAIPKYQELFNKLVAKFKDKIGLTRNKQLQDLSDALKDKIDRLMAKDAENKDALQKAKEALAEAQANLLKEAKELRAMGETKLNLRKVVKETTAIIKALDETIAKDEALLNTLVEEQKALVLALQEELSVVLTKIKIHAINSAELTRLREEIETNRKLLKKIKTSLRKLIDEIKKRYNVIPEELRNEIDKAMEAINKSSYNGQSKKQTADDIAEQNKARYPSPVLLTKRPNPNGPNQVLEVDPNDSDTMLADARIEKAIQNAKDIDGFYQSMVNLGYFWNAGAENNTIRSFVEDRIAGKTDIPYAEFRRDTSKAYADTEVTPETQEEVDLQELQDFVKQANKAVTEQEERDLLQKTITEMEARIAELEKSVADSEKEVGGLQLAIKKYAKIELMKALRVRYKPTEADIALQNLFGPGMGASVQFTQGEEERRRWEGQDPYIKLLEEYYYTTIDPNYGEKPETDRHQRFLNRLSSMTEKEIEKKLLKRGVNTATSLVTIVVTQHNIEALGLKGLVDESRFTDDIEDTGIYTVYAVKQKIDGKDTYTLLDENLKRVKVIDGKQATQKQLNDIVFSQFRRRTMDQGTADKYLKSTLNYTADDLLEAQAEAKAYFTKLVEDSKDTTYVDEDSGEEKPHIPRILVERNTKPFTISKGIANRHENADNTFAKNSFESTVLNEEIKEDTVFVPTVKAGESISENKPTAIVGTGARTQKLTIGRPYVRTRNGIVDQYHYADNNMLTPNQVETIVQVLTQLARDAENKLNKELLALNKNKKLPARDSGEWLLLMADYNILNKDKGTALNQDLIKYLKSVLYWSIPKEGKLEDVNSRQIWLRGGKLYLNNTAILDFTAPDSIARSSELREWLQNYNHNIKKQGAEESKKAYTEYYLDKKGKLQERKWKSYNHYLLEEKNPDGSAREMIPLTTAIQTPEQQKATPGMPAEYFPYKAKGVIINPENIEKKEKENKVKAQKSEKGKPKKKTNGIWVKGRFIPGKWVNGKFVKAAPKKSLEERQLEALERIEKKLDGKPKTVFVRPDEVDPEDWDDMMAARGYSQDKNGNWYEGTDEDVYEDDEEDDEDDGNYFDDEESGTSSDDITDDELFVDFSRQDYKDWYDQEEVDSFEFTDDLSDEEIRQNLIDWWREHVQGTEEETTEEVVVEEKTKTKTNKSRTIFVKPDEVDQEDWVEMMEEMGRAKDKNGNYYEDADEDVDEGTDEGTDEDDADDEPGGDNAPFDTTEDEGEAENEGDEDLFDFDNYISEGSNEKADEGKGGKNSRIIGSNTVYNKENIKKVVAELARMLPQVPLHILEEVIRVNATTEAWGQFTGNAILLFRGAEEGTLYHEAFEVVANSILTNREMNRLIDEFRSRKGEFVDRESGKTIAYADASPYQAKEELAEEFRDYKLTGRTFKGEKQMSFFKKLLQFLQNLIFNLADIETTFSRLDRGFYADKVLMNNPRFGKSNYRHLKQVPEAYYNKYIRSVTARMFKEIFLTGESLAAVDEITIGGKELYDRVKKSINAAYTNLENDLKKEQPYYKHLKGLTTRSPREQRDLNRIVKKVNDYKNAKAQWNVIAGTPENWGKFVDDHQRYLKQFRISFGEEDLTDDAIDESQEKTDNKNQREYGTDAFELDAKNSAPASIKLLFAALTNSKFLKEVGANNKPEVVPVHEEDPTIFLETTDNFDALSKKVLNGLNGINNLEQIRLALLDMIGIKGIENLSKGDAEDTISQLSEEQATLYRLYTRVFDSDEEISMDAKYNLQIKFNNYVAKQAPVPSIMMLTNKGNVYFMTSYARDFAFEIRKAFEDTISASDRHKAGKKEGIGTAKAGKKVPDVTYFKVNGFTTDKGKILTVNTPEQMQKVFELMGLDEYFNEEFVNNLESPEFAYISTVLNIIMSEIYKRNNDQTITSLNATGLGVPGRFAELIKFYVEKTQREVPTTFANVENKQRQTFVLNNYLSRILAEMNNSADIEEFYQKNPQYQDIFARDSIIIKKLFDENTGKRTGEKLKLGYVEGWKEEGAQAGHSVSSLSLTDRMILGFNSNLNGHYYTIIPADSETEWTLKLGNTVEFSNEVFSGESYKNIMKIFKGYLATEIELAIKEYGKELANLNIATKNEKIDEKTGKVTKRKVYESLRFFDHMLSQALLDKIYEKIDKKDMSAESIIKAHKPAIEKEIAKYFEQKASDNIKLFEDNKIIKNIPSPITGAPSFKNIMYSLDDTTASSMGLTLNPETNAYEIDNDDLNNLFQWHAINFAIANIEMYKAFFGDPAQFKDAEKRIKSFLSPVEWSFYDETDEFNKHFNQSRNTINYVDKDTETGEEHIVKTAIPEGDITNHVFSNELTVLSVKDIIATNPKLFEQVRQFMSDELADKYIDINEADGQSATDIQSFRELMIKSGHRWTNKMERQYQFEMAYARKKLAKKGKYKYPNDDVRNADDKLLAPYTDKKTGEIEAPAFAEFNIYKPVYAGSEASADFRSYLLKTSVFPITYRAVENKDYEDLYVAMLNGVEHNGANRKVNIFAFESANKVGLKLNDTAKVPSVYSYNEKGHVIGNFTAAEHPLTILSFKHYGIQVETQASKNSQTLGTQISKLAKANFMYNGVPKDWSNRYKNPDGTYTFNGETGDIGVMLEAFDAMSEQEKEAVSPDYADIRRHEEALNNLKAKLYREMLGKFGLKEMVKLVNGEKFIYYEYKNLTKMRDLILAELTRRNIDENTVDSIELSEDLQRFKNAAETLPSYNLIRNIIFSIVDKAFLSPKVNGKPRIQLASSFFNDSNTRKAMYAEVTKDETTGKDVYNWVTLNSKEEYDQAVEDGKKIVFSSNELAVYEIEQDGKKVKAMEVLVPDIYFHKVNAKRKQKGLPELTRAELKEHLNKNPKLLEGVGFRIPTQATSSIEFFVIKDFLPETMGSAIVVPSMITSKAGSDFDVDKLSTYMNNWVLDKNGMPVYEEFDIDMSEDAIQKRYDSQYKVFRNALEDFKKKFVDKNDIVFDDPIVDIILRDLFKSVLTEDEILESEIQASSVAGRYAWLKKKAQEEAENSPTMEEFKDMDIVLQNTVGSLQNIYFESIRTLMSKPSNFKQLMQPNSADLIDQNRNDIMTAKDPNYKPKDKIVKYANLISFDHLTRQRHYFVRGKKDVGVFAVATTNNVNAQLVGGIIKIDPEDVSERDVKAILTLNDGSDHLPFEVNKITINGVTYTSFAAESDPSGMSISDKISAYVNGAVDVAKDPMIIEMGMDSVFAGIYQFMERITDSQTTALFMMQPSIRQYLQEKLLKRSILPLGQTHNNMIQEILDLYGTGDFKYDDTFMVDKEQMIRVIGKAAAGTSLTTEEKKAQVQIFVNFLKLEVLQNHLLSNVMASNHDTTNFASDYNIEQKEHKTRTVRKGNFIKSYKNGEFMSLADAILKFTFVGKDAERLHEIPKLFGTEIFALKDPNAVKFMKEYVVKVLTENPYLSVDKFNKIMRGIEISTLDFLINNSEFVGANGAKIPFHQTAKVILSPRHEHGLMSVYRDLKRQMKADKDAGRENTLRNNYFLQEFRINTDPRDGVVTFELRNKPSNSDTYTKDRITEALNQLKETPSSKKFYDTLIQAIILRNGLKFSRDSLLDRIPNADFAEKVNKGLSGMSTVSFKKVEAAYVRRHMADDMETTLPMNLEYINIVANKRKEYSPIVTQRPSSVWHDENVIWSRTEAGGKSKIKLQIPDQPGKASHIIFIDEYDAQSYGRKKEYVLIPNTKQGMDIDAMIKVKDWSFMEHVLYRRVGLDNKHEVTITSEYIDKKTNKKRTSVKIAYKPISRWGSKAVNEVKGISDIDGELIGDSSILKSNYKYEEMTDELAIDLLRIAQQTRPNIIIQDPSEVHDEEVEEAYSTEEELNESRDAFEKRMKKNSISGKIVLSLQEETTQRNATNAKKYAVRTRKNAGAADATIAIAVDFTSRGEQLTKTDVLGQGKKYVPLNVKASLTVTPEIVEGIVKQLNSVNATSLNIAGNGIYTMKGQYTQEEVDNFTYDLLNQVLNSPNLKNKITSIRSGGQTGFDEAGAKAGMQLGIPTTILAPSGWLFRDAEGSDISNEAQFKARFETTTPLRGVTPLKKGKSGKPGALFDPNEKPLNIYYKGSKNDNKNLSNLAPRSFTFNSRTYHSVEHAYQTLKSGSFDQVTYDKYKSGGVKIAGNKGTNTRNNYNIRLMENLIRESIKQNADVAEELLATGNRELTHTQDTGIWKTAFPEILMKIRSELQQPESTLRQEIDDVIKSKNDESKNCNK